MRGRKVTGRLYWRWLTVLEKDRFCIETGELIVSLEERDCFRYPIEGHTYRPNGFYESSKVQDFPLRDKKMTLLIKRRRWIDETTGKSVGNNYELTAEGTRHSMEFATFLKVLHPRGGNKIQRTQTPHLSTFC